MRMPFEDFSRLLTDDYVARSDETSPRAKVEFSAMTVGNIDVAVSLHWSWAIEMGLTISRLLKGDPCARCNRPPFEFYGSQRTGLANRWREE